MAAASISNYNKWLLLVFQANPTGCCLNFAEHSAEYFDTKTALSGQQDKCNQMAVASVSGYTKRLLLILSGYSVTATMQVAAEIF